MKALVAAALCVVLLLLAAIAFDLHQLALVSGRMTGVGAYALHLTPEQRVEARKRSDAEFERWWKAEFGVTSKVPETSSSRQRHQSQ
jgi:hypothetical protein